jgi:hypothetical protein
MYLFFCKELKVRRVTIKICDDYGGGMVGDRNKEVRG